MGIYLDIINCVVESTEYNLGHRAKKSGPIIDLGQKLYFKWTKNVPSGYEDQYVYYLDSLKNNNVKVLWIDGNKAKIKTISRPDEYTVVDMDDVPDYVKKAVKKKLD
jgi:membrane peptidoglycan carboxypeptidase